jgi:hypothetical protein
MRWEIDSIIALQQLREQLPGLTALLSACSFLGKEEFFLLLIPLIYLCADTRVGIRLGLLVLLGDTLNLFGKLAFHAPRPYWLNSGVLPLSLESSYGLPSSHAQNAVSVWTFLALQVKKRWFWIVAVCVIFLISLSRVYLGVHFWSDVVIGWMIGVLFLVLFLRYVPRAEAWFLSSTLCANCGISCVEPCAATFRRSTPRRAAGSRFGFMGALRGGGEYSGAAGWSLRRDLRPGNRLGVEPARGAL